MLVRSTIIRSAHRPLIKAGTCHAIRAEVEDGAATHTGMMVLLLMRLMCLVSTWTSGVDLSIVGSFLPMRSK